MRTDRPGFVLLEAMAALMIVSVVAVALFSSVGAQLRVTERAELLITADELARERLLKLETLTPDELVPLADSLKGGSFLPPFDRYAWAATVSAQLGSRNLYDVAVRVSWSDGSHELRTRMYRVARRLES
ncbi:MAG: type IV pilus modification PilV family protein [Pseudomonas sp.]